MSKKTAISVMLCWLALGTGCASLAVSEPTPASIRLEMVVTEADGAYKATATRPAAQSSIVGTVTDQSSQQPAAGVVVVIEKTGKIGSKRTDDSGSYAFNDLPAGQYLVSLQLDDHERAVQGPVYVVVDGQNSLTVDLAYYSQAKPPPAPAIILLPETGTDEETGLRPTSAPPPAPRPTPSPPAKSMPDLLPDQHISASGSYSQTETQAAGPMVCRIQRDSCAYNFLIGDLDASIVFKREEESPYDEEDILIHPDMLLPLYRLSTLVEAEWGGAVRLRVTDAYDSLLEHDLAQIDEGRKYSLHFEGRSVDLTTWPIEPARYGRLCVLAHYAGFDWVHNEIDHCHASIQADSLCRRCRD